MPIDMDELETQLEKVQLKMDENYAQRNALSNKNGELRELCHMLEDLKNGVIIKDRFSGQELTQAQKDSAYNQIKSRIANI